MDWEYMALSWGTEDARQDVGFMERRLMLLAQGWEEYCRAIWSGINHGGACIMRRPKDEPRKWTKKEIEEIAKGTQGSVLNERAMQADLCGRLERRNAELQAAIDEVVDTERHPPQGRLPLAPVPRHYLTMRAAIRKHLSPLASPRKHQGHAEAGAVPEDSRFQE